MTREIWNMFFFEEMIIITPTNDNKRLPTIHITIMLCYKRLGQTSTHLRAFFEIPNTFCIHTVDVS